MELLYKIKKLDEGYLLEFQNKTIAINNSDALKDYISHGLNNMLLDINKAEVDYLEIKLSSEKINLLSPFKINQYTHGKGKI